MKRARQGREGHDSHSLLSRAVMASMLGLAVSSCESHERETSEGTVTLALEIPGMAAVAKEVADNGSTTAILVMRGEPPRPSSARTTFGPGVSVVRRLASSGAVVVRLNSVGLVSMARHPELFHAIELDREGGAHLTEAGSILRAPLVHVGQGFRGSGLSVAVLDSGIDGAHPDLSGKVIVEHCFTDSGCGAGGTGPSESSSAFDDTGHGTHVAGIIASRGALAPAGLAPEARVIAMKVLTNNKGRTSDWIAAIDWLTSAFDQHPFQALNMSLGTSALHQGDCRAEYPALSAAIDGLLARGVVVVASTGNQGALTEISAPACISGVIAVGATLDDDWPRLPEFGTYAHFGDRTSADCFDLPANVDQIACFSNLSDRVRLVAPGAAIAAPTPFHVDDLGFRTSFGTSQAAPAVTAIAGLMVEANPLLGPADVASILGDTGADAWHPAAGINLRRVDASAAVGRAQCHAKPDGASCDDGDACSVDDVCQAETCTSEHDRADGYPCSDGNDCTVGDACADGSCRPGGPKACATPGECLAAAFCRVAGGECVDHWAAQGSPCDDGDPCTSYDHCESGFCVGRALCQQVGGCGVATCDPAAGECVIEVKPDGAACPGGICADGSCKEVGEVRASEPETAGCFCGTVASGRTRGVDLHLMLLACILGALRRMR